MATDYTAIRFDNQKEYGNVARWGPNLLVNRYDSSAHFIFEILQNAEDALKRRKNWHGSHEIRFELSPSTLRILHCGNPFTLKDVRGVCGIGETNKDLTDIGHFGVGFKSVYAISDRPEVHSGAEDFAIDQFVFPISVPTTDREADETEFILPLRTAEASLYSTVAESLVKLGSRTLLFLRKLDSIAWSFDGGSCGLYKKGPPKAQKSGGRRVSLFEGREGNPGIAETWLVYSRTVKTDADVDAGRIEIAFQLQKNNTTRRWGIHRIDDSPLNVYFPTVVTTHLGFLVQGPYRTTPSRDNVPQRDPWNVKLVQQTAVLLVESLEALRDEDLLDVAALQSMPLERAKYPDGSMFAPLFDAVRTALSSQPLLPRFRGGWVAAKNSRLARTQDLRELLEPMQLAALLNEREEVHWLSGEITRDSASTLHTYIMRELGVVELTPEVILSKMDRKFLLAQTDEWILKLYEFLCGQTALIRQQGRLGAIPLVRLDNGTHVVGVMNDQPQAFLPSTITTDFPTVRRAVCGTTKAVDFLRAMGLTEPDAVEDVIRNILPKYMKETVEVDGDEYSADISRIVCAFNTDLRGQRERLIKTLCKASFVMSVDLGDGAKYVSKPGDVYFATERFKRLFANVDGVMLVDDSYTCLGGEDIRNVLEACNASRTLCPEEAPCSLTWEEQLELRSNAGCVKMTGEPIIKDKSLRGLPKLLALLPNLDSDGRKRRARLLWEALKDVEQHCDTGIFLGLYIWTYYSPRSANFDPDFVRMLNTVAWIPDADGNLRRPELVVFDSLGWEASSILTSKIRFKSPTIDNLAREAGIDPKILECIRNCSPARLAKFVAALRLEENAVVDQLGSADPNLQVPEPAADETESGGSGGPECGATSSRGDGLTLWDPDAADAHEPGGVSPGPKSDHLSGGSDRSRTRSTGSIGGRAFVSYLGVHPTEEEPDPDGLTHEFRMDLEERAIQFILSKEERLQRTKVGNKGFDLFETGSGTQIVRWVEVKAMTGGLNGRPVGMSSAQFQCAQEHRDAFWLYVVEHATDPTTARLVRIQDPAGKARTFTFDCGWLEIASWDDAK